MLSADPQTFESLKVLWGLAERSGHKPILIWVGAGASSWLGYERWAEVAERFHRTFLRKASASYNARDASAALKNQDYPQLFQRCFDASPQMYRSMLAQSFSPKSIKPVYKRFVEAINRIEGVSLVTTNVDDMLERAIPDFQVLQRSDLSRVTELLAAKSPFVGKLHGSVSAIETAIFKADDYKSLEEDLPYIESLKYLMAACSILFIGYGVRDKYVIDLLSRSSTTFSLFGDGPHFLISSDTRSELPQSVHPVLYQTELHTDHRSAILAIEIIARPAVEAASLDFGGSAQECADVPKSAHLLSDFYPAGAWGTTGQIAAVKREDGTTSEIIVGPGWTQTEMPRTATAVHDLAVGLMCFDQVLVPLECISRVFDFLGESRFRALVFAGVLQFVHWEGFDLVMCFSDSPGYGCLATGKKGGGESSGEMIRRQMNPASGREEEGTELISRLEQMAISIDLSGTGNFADLCSGLFSSPVTRRVLGMSDGTPVGHVPRWLAYPALRLVQIARIGATCQKLALGSMKLMTGAAKLAELAFSAVAGGVLASEPATYALTGQFGIIDPKAFLTDPGIWDSVIKFRESNSGVEFRSEIFKRLLRNEAAEIVPAVDSSLRQILPARLMQSARQEFAALLVSTVGHHVVPAIWNDAALLQEGPEAWRKVSRQRLLAFMATHNIGGYDDCPCGSYDKAKFCCLSALE